MLNSMNLKSLSVGGLLALAIATYIITVPNEGMLSGPNTISALLHSLPLITF